MKKFLSFMFMVMSVTALFAQNVMKPNGKHPTPI